jgi:hypothetical protein
MVDGVNGRATSGNELSRPFGKDMPTRRAETGGTDGWTMISANFAPQLAA